MDDGREELCSRTSTSRRVDHKGWKGLARSLALNGLDSSAMAPSPAAVKCPALAVCACIRIRGKSNAALKCSTERREGGVKGSQTTHKMGLSCTGAACAEDFAHAAAFRGGMFSNRRSVEFVTGGGGGALRGDSINHKHTL